MKTNMMKSGIFFLVSLMLLIGSGLQAQDSKKAPKEKQSRKTVQIKMTTIDENGKKITIDTSFTTTEADEKVIMKKFSTGDKDEAKHITMEIEMDDDFPLGLNPDSLEKKIMKEITVIAGPDGEFEWTTKDGDFDYSFFNERDMPKVMKFDCGPDQESGCPMCRLRQQFPGYNQGFNFLSPTDIIKKFDIRKKRNGKKIIIVTENGDFWSMMPPPPPPVPPCPPECTKKVIMLNHDGAMKKVEKEMRKAEKDMKKAEKDMKKMEMEMEKQEKETH